MRPKTPALIRELESLRGAQGRSAGRKLQIMDVLGRERFDGRARPAARWLLRYHEALLFHAAYPDDRRVWRAALTGLDGIAARLRPALARHLGDSGLPLTETRYAYGLANARWLAAQPRERLRLALGNWDQSERLEQILFLLAGRAEDAATEDQDLSLKEWLDLAAGPRGAAALVIERFAALPASSELAYTLYNSLDLPLAWTITDPALSRGGNRLAGAALGLHRSPLVRQAPPLGAHLRRPPATIEHLSGRRARRLIDMANAALATRQREMYPIELADPRDVRLHTLEDGCQIATYGIAPDYRLFLEALWGFLLLKNGLPVGYGCYSVLGGSAEVAWNIFESFRRGESARLYAQLLRVIHHHTGARAFTAERYQFGHENEEAVASGAFWFYHKLGFRHLEPRARALAQREERRVRARAGYRSSPATLRRLARANLYFFLDRPARAVLGETPYAQVARAIGAWIARAHRGDRPAALRAARRSAEQALGGRLPADPLTGEWCLLLALIPGLSRWTAAERHDLKRALARRARGDEAGYARALAQHRRLAAALLRLAKKMKPRPETPAAASETRLRTADYRS